MSAPNDSSGVRVFPPAVYLCGLLAGFILQKFWPVRIVSSDLATPARFLGIALVVCGFALAIWAVRTFRLSGTTPNPTQPTTALAFAGPYRFTRNPMYLGLGAMSAGIAVWANAVWPLVFVPVVLLVVQRIVIAPEERYLERKFGQEYVTFKTQVRRWL